jgi:ribonuclease-3
VAALFSTNSPNRAARHLTEQSGWTQHRLAWLGDSVLRLLVTMQFASDPKLGRAHESRCRLETNVFLAQKAKVTGLVELSVSAQVPNSTWPVATLVEAVLGAVFQDSGEDLQAARSVLCALGVLQ